jgi:glycosyltransferase involved in cell wall biosynthesis
VADVIRTNSSLVSQTLVAGGANPKKVVSVPLGADIGGMQPLRPRKKGEPVRFMVSGPVSLRKGGYFVLQAWKKLRPKGATLNFYGSMQMEMRAEDRGVTGVTFYGNRPQAEVQEAYRNAHVLIFPTLCDGFGMVVPEAMAAGCAVITTKNAGAADWIEEGKNGWVVKPGDANALAEAIEKALDAGDRLEAMRAQAQERARQNSWDHFRENFRQTLTKSLFLRAKA